MIKETLTLFLAHQQQTLEHEESTGYNNESAAQSHHEQITELSMKTEEEREIFAAQIVQVKESLLNFEFDCCPFFLIRLIGVVIKFEQKTNEIIIQSLRS